MYYRESTPKDFFVAALSGPGYMYDHARRTLFRYQRFMARAT